MATATATAETATTMVAEVTAREGLVATAEAAQMNHTVTRMAGHAAPTTLAQLANTHAKDIKRWLPCQIAKGEAIATVETQHDSGGR